MGVGVGVAVISYTFGRGRRRSGVSNMAGSSSRLNIIDLIPASVIEPVLSIYAVTVGKGREQKRPIQLRSGTKVVFN